MVRARPKHRLSVFTADLRELLWRYKAELSVELDSKGHLNFDAALRVYWPDGTHDRLPNNIEGKEPPP